MCCVFVLFTFLLLGLVPWALSNIVVTSLEKRGGMCVCVCVCVCVSVCSGGGGVCGRGRGWGGRRKAGCFTFR